MAEALSMQEVGNIARRFWLILVALVGLGGIGGYFGARMLPPTYTATATALVKGVPGTDATANYQAAQYAISRARTYPVFIDSLPVLEAVRSDMGGSATIIDLEDRLTAGNPIDTPLVQVNAEATTADGARDLANSAARHLARYITQIETVNGSSPVTVEVAVQASAPRSPAAPRPIVIGGLAAFGAGCIGLAGVTLFDRLGRPLVAARRLRRATRDSDGDTSSGTGASTDDDPELPRPQAEEQAAVRTGSPIDEAANASGEARDPASARASA